MPVDCKRVVCGGVASSEEGMSHGRWRGGVEVGAATKTVAPHRGFVRTKKNEFLQKENQRLFMQFYVCVCLFAVSLYVANANAQSHLWLLVL